MGGHGQAAGAEVAVVTPLVLSVPWRCSSDVEEGYRASGVARTVGVTVAVNVTAWPNTDGCSRRQRSGRRHRAVVIHRLGQRAGAIQEVAVSSIGCGDGVAPDRQARGGEDRGSQTAVVLTVPGQCSCRRRGKITVPWGSRPPHCRGVTLTVAVKVTDCPEPEGLADEMTAVVVEAC